MVLQKVCKCGQPMSIRLRTVIYQNKVDIENVPIFSCEACSRSEVFPGVKSELAGLIKDLGANPDKKNVPFNELSELASLMCKVSDKALKDLPVERILNDRINELLDLLLLAQSLGDDPWMEDIRRRLTQITRHASTTYGMQ